MKEPFIRPYHGGVMGGTRGWLHPWKVAEHLNCTKRYVYELVSQGKLEAIRLGPRALRISEASLQGFIDKMKVQSSEKV